MTDPFVSIYEIVFQLTMRMVGCDEIANDPALLKKTLHLFETIQRSSTPTTIIFPWFPSPALIKRTIAGGRLYMILKKIVDERKKSGRREDDPLQYLIDNGDDMNEIIGVRIPHRCFSTYPSTNTILTLVHTWRPLRWPAQ